VEIRVGNVARGLVEYGQLLRSWLVVWRVVVVVMMVVVVVVVVVVVDICDGGCMHTSCQAYIEVSGWVGLRSLL